MNNMNQPNDLELFFDNVKKYCSNIIDDKTFALYTGFTPNTIKKIKIMNIDTIEKIHININILISNNLSYDNIITIINNNYSHPLLDAMREINMYLLNLYFKHMNIMEYRYGQKEAYNIFRKKIKQPQYWGLMIAPTGWGKSMMHYLFMGYFFKKSNKNILLLTKRKDILSDVIKEIEGAIETLKEKNMFPNIDITICDQVNNKLDDNKINECKNYSVVIVNSDKLITRDKKNDDFNPAKLNKIKWKYFGLVLFDEVHWAGSKRNVQFMNYLKNKILFGIGSSATPIRKSLQNQENIKLLYGENYDIMYELSYIDAWNNKVILKIDTIMFPIYSDNIVNKGEKNKKYIYDVNIKTKKMIIKKINGLLRLSYKKKMIIFFRCRLSLLYWYKYFTRNNSFNNMKYYMSMTFTDSFYDEQKNKTTDEQVNSMIEYLEINKKAILTGITKFKKQQNNAILLVVNRANEGFNDPPVDICVNLDFTKNNNMLVSLQRMGRAQRLCNDKEKGYYLCPILADNEEQFKNIMADSISNYIAATTKNVVATIDGKKPHISKEIMSYILGSFKTDGITNYTHEDLMKRILRLEKEKNMTLEQFMNILKTYNICDHDAYHNVWNNDESFKELGMPQFYKIAFKDFAWNMINNNDYYDEKEIVSKMFKIYKNNVKLFNKITDYNDIREIFCKIDNKIPYEYPWVYYNINKAQFSFVYN